MAAPPHSTPNTTGQPPAAQRPQLEVWRRPGIEKFRRHDDGQLHKES
jgi:hypothetical protein